MSDLAVRQRTEPAPPQEGCCKWCGDDLPADRYRNKEYCDSTCRAEFSLWKKRAASEASNGAANPLRSAEAKPLTQRDRILYELRQAGDGGVRSDVFFRLNMPRAGARIYELRREGFEIESETAGQFVRYTLVAEPGSPAPSSTAVSPTSPFSPENDFA